MKRFHNDQDGTIIVCELCETLINEERTDDTTTYHSPVEIDCPRSCCEICEGKV
jgi:hypothetical protein